MHEVLVNRLGGLSLPRKSVVRLTDRPDMTLDVYRGRKTTIQKKIWAKHFVPFQQQNGPVPRMSHSFITSQTKQLFKRYLYILKYFIILYDKNGPGIDKPSKVS